MWSIKGDRDNTWREYTWAPRNHNGLIKQPDSLWLPFRHISCVVNRVPAKPQEGNYQYSSLMAVPPSMLSAYTGKE